MPRHPRVLTRAAVFYGDRFSEACSVFRISGAVLDAANVVSTGTTTKLNRRYRGAPIENATRDRIVDYFRKALNPEIQERLRAKGIDLEQILLPATFRLSDHGCVLYTRLDRPYRITGILKADYVSDTNVRLILRGGYGVRKHIISVAEHIFQYGGDLVSAGGISAPDDLVEEMTDYNACHPSIYRIEGRSRDTQWTLLSGGRRS
jgi:hypothetical protein